MLLASHLRFQQIPTKIEFRHLLDICLFCDKYNCPFVIQPWISSWLTPLVAELYDFGLVEECIVSALILGHEAVLMRAAYRLLCECKTDSQQRCLPSKLEYVDNIPSELASEYTVC